MPGLNRLTQLHADAVVAYFPTMREAEFQEGGKPFSLKGKTVIIQIGNHVTQILPDKVRHHPAIVQRRAPAD